MGVLHKSLRVSCHINGSDPATGTAIVFFKQKLPEVGVEDKEADYG